MSFRHRKIPKLIPLISFIILLVLIPLAISFLQTPGGVEAAWVDDNFSYRNAIPITSHTAAETNVYISATIDTSASGQFQADCGDLRFTTVGGDILPYYIVSGCVSASTVVHVFFKSMPAGAQTIYYYYGNPSAANGFSSADFATVASSYALGSIASQEKGGAPIAYWKFDDGTGTTLQDSGPNNLDGTLGTGPTWNQEDQCLLGKCIRVAGSGNTSVSYNPILNIASNVTYNVWVQLNQIHATQWPIILGRNSHLSYGFRHNKTTGSVYFEYGYGACDGNTYTNRSLSTTLTDSKWHMLTMTQDGSYLKVFVDGVQISSVAHTAFCTDTSNPLYLQTNLYGAVDETKIYNYARTAAQIKSDFKSRGTAKGSSVVIASGTKQSMSEGLVGYWKTDEATWSGTASEVLDASGNANHGTAQGTVGGKAYPAGGKFGNGGFFDGVDDYFRVEDSSTMDGMSGLTMSVWLNPTSVSGTKDVIHKDQSYEISIISGVVKVAIGTQWAYQTGPSITAGIWTHITSTWDGSTLKIFKDGELSNTYTLTSGSIPNNSNWIAVGGNMVYLGTYNYPGKIDEVRIYNRALSPREVRDLYNYAPGPLAYFNFEEGSGATVLDSSGNSLAATWAGTNNHYTSGMYGKGGNLSTTSDYAYSSNGSFNMGYNDFTISTWIKTNTTTRQYIIDKGAGDGLNGFRFETSTDFKLLAIIGGPSSRVDIVGNGKTINDGAWHYISVVYVRNGNGQIYIDGVASSSPTNISSLNGVNITNGTNFAIGSTGGGAGSRFTGLVDEVRIYNYARNQKQIVEDMNAGHPVGGSPVGSQRLYWKMDEGYSTTTNDSSSQNNSGTLNCVGQGMGCTNPTWSNSGKFNKALYFTGSGTWGNGKWQYVTRNSINISSTVGSKMTWSMWLKPDATQNSGGWIFRNGTGTDENYAINLAGSSGGYFNVQLTGYDTTFRSINTTGYIVPASTWSQLTVIYSQGQWMKIYVNGVFKEQVTWPYGATVQSASSFNIGGHTGSNQWYDGYIDEFKIYDDELTSDEIKLDYNRGSALVLGNTGEASSSAGTSYCVPGDASTCTPPVARWDFEEGSGNANDTSGNGNTGTPTGTTIVPGKIGKARNFNGSTDYVNAGVGATLDITSAVTMEAWVYLKSTSGARYIGGKSTDEWILYFPAGSSTPRVYMEDVTATSLDAGSSINLNQWYHIAFTYDKDAGTNNRKIYINGSLSNQNTATGALGISAEPFLIGAFNTTPSNPFNGYIDGVRIYNYARTAAQVAWDYNRGGPVGHWRMDECQGATAKDSSGNGNNGTITIGATGTQTAVGTCTTSGTAWYNGVTGKFNSSLNFDGTDDYALVTEPSNNIYDSDYVTVSAWYKSASADPTGWQKIVGKGPDGTEAFGIWVNPATDYAYVDMQISGTQRNVGNSTTDVADQNWHHIVTTYDGSNGKIYIDGKLERTSATYTGVISANNENVSIGREKSSTTDAYSTNGQIDDVRIYNYALTPLQIRLLFNGSSAVRFGPQTGSP